MIPFIDLKAQYESLKPDIDAAVARVLASGWYVLGPEVEAFEETYARHAGCAFGVGAGSGTGALHLALLAAGWINYQVYFQKRIRKYHYLAIELCLRW